MPDENRKLAAILAVDCVGYSAAAERDQASAAHRVASLRARLEGLAQEQGGRVFSTAGDGFMLEFPLASAAVRAALTLLAEAARADGDLPRVRAGAHLGEVLISDHDLLGHGVNVAARLSALAEPNGLVISEPLKTQLRGEIDVAFTSIGKVRLSKMREVVEAFAYSPARQRLWARLLVAAARRHRRASIFALASLALSLSAAVWFAFQRVDYIADDIELVVYGDENEYWPTLTPDGRFLIYAADVGPSPSMNYDLFMRSLAAGETTRLTNTPDLVELAPAVSPGGDRLAYIRNVGQHILGQEGFSPCQIVVRTLPDGLDRQVGLCDGVEGTSRIAWTPDGRALVYSDRPASSPEAPSRLRLLDLHTGQSRELVPSPENGFGDFNATISPDGRRVAFVRYGALGAADVHVYDLRRRRLTRVTEGEQWAHTAWADDRALFVILARGNNNELWLYNTSAPGGGMRRLLPALQRIQRPERVGHVLAVELHVRNVNLARHNGRGVEFVASGTQVDFSPDFSRDGILAFIRSQAGNWVYIQRPGQQPRRLTSLDYADPLGLRWSPDGSQMTFTAVDDGVRRIFVIDAASGIVTPVETAAGHEPGNASWTVDGSGLLYTDNAGAAPQLMRISVAGGSPEPISPPDWVEAIDTLGGTLATNAEGRGIWRLSADREPELVYEAYLAHGRDNPRGRNAARDWAIVGETLYVVQTTSGHSRIVAIALDGGPPRTVASTEAVFDGGLAVDPLTRDIVYMVVAADHSDIGLIHLRRR